MGNQNNGQVHRTGNRRYVRESLDPLDFLRDRMDRVDLSRETLVLEAHQENAAAFHLPG